MRGNPDQFLLGPVRCPLLPGEVGTQKAPQLFLLSLEETSQQEERPKAVSPLGFLPTTLRWSWAEHTGWNLEWKSRNLK